LHEQIGSDDFYGEGQYPSRSNVTLMAPHGTIDLGSAGLRGTTVTPPALSGLNSYNVKDTNVVGLALTPLPNTARRPPPPTPPRLPSRPRRSRSRKSPYQVLGGGP